jgi:hypothetical protein
VLSDVEKIFMGADCAGLLWMLLLGICECCDGGHSWYCVWPACRQNSNGSARTFADDFSYSLTIIDDFSYSLAISFSFAIAVSYSLTNSFADTDAVSDTISYSFTNAVSHAISHSLTDCYNCSYADAGNRGYYWWRKWDNLFRIHVGRTWNGAGCDRDYRVYSLFEEDVRRSLLRAGVGA